jgi:hypothetical protein
MTRGHIPPLGNIREQSFNEIWEDVAYRQIRTECFKPMEKSEILAESLLESDSLLSKARKQASRFHTPVIGFVGELRKKKGLPSLLYAYAQANK